MSNSNDSNNMTLNFIPEINSKTNSMTQLDEPIIPSVDTNVDINKPIKSEDPVDSLMLDEDFNILLTNSNPTSTNTKLQHESQLTQHTQPKQENQQLLLPPIEKKVKIEDPIIKNRSSTSSHHSQRHEIHDEEEEEDQSNARVSAYAKLEFENNIFYVQTLQIILGRKSNDESNQTNVDVHLSEKKAISRKHAKIFYNFGSQRFEISVTGKNGAFVNETFVEKGMTIPLVNGVKIQIGEISFSFKLPEQDDRDKDSQFGPVQFNPSDAINLKSNLFSKQPTPKNSPKKTNQQITQPSTEPIPAATRKKSMSRRDSLLKIRKLSNARRTSVAANEELNQLLKDLGMEENINEEDSELLDEQIKILLNEDDNLEGSNVLKNLAHLNESAIADDDDDLDLVKGIEQEARVEKEIQEIDSNISQLNREIANLTGPPNNIAQNQSLITEKENQKKGLEEAKKQKQDHISQSRSSFVRNAGPVRTTPLMGKPASIQPPASSSIYNRYHGLDKSGLHFFPNAIPPPRPKLTVPVPLITSEPGAIRSRPPLRAITMRDSTLHSTISYPKTLDQPTEFPKPKTRKIIPRKTSKRVYTMDEIPEQFRIKPNITFASMVTNVLQTSAARQGLTINEITDAVKEVYPYYKYCQEGWQASINHCIKFTKIFKRISKKGTEWLYTMDELYKNERETMKIKQREILAKIEAERQEEFRQRQRLEMNQQFLMNRNFQQQQQPQPQYPIKTYNQTPGVPLNQQNNQILPPNQNVQQSFQQNFQQPPRQGVNLPNGQQPYVSTTTQQPPLPNQPQQSQQSQPQHPTSANTTPTQAKPPITQTQPSISDPKTQKSLEYLRKELFTLYKSRNLTYDKTIATTLITKALTTTIAQVNSIGAKVGAGDNALTFLVEKAPQQVSKILDIALTKSIKEFEGNKSGAGTPSKASTPLQTEATLSNQSLQSHPQQQPTSNIPVSTHQSNTTIQQPQQLSKQVHSQSTFASPSPQQSQQNIISQQQNTSQTQPQTIIHNNNSVGSSTQSSPTTSTTATTSTTTLKQFSPSPQPSPQSTTSTTSSPHRNTIPPRPSSFGKPPNLKNNNTLNRPGSYARPQSFGKPPGISSQTSNNGGVNNGRPTPSFLSNKPTFGNNNNNNNGLKRELDGGNESNDQLKKIARSN
ncbi:FHL1 [Candida pseudojiufengensis]|uniref:FHL1 n=1 Tax=Candida pseudojiufengensis TaxID=497109 RepID=UPI002224626D|nr:FHL1 [Candida pseudojiufengensis]KAI5966169.1 FHL1 [Candida pseudojiufengensis]